jgi:hypothetical protein
MPVRALISGGMGTSGVDQGVEAAEHLATADLDGADLGDAVVGGRPAGGLQVQHHELDVEQRRSEVVEASLDGDGCGGHPGRFLSSALGCRARR